MKPRLLIFLGCVALQCPVAKATQYQFTLTGIVNSVDQPTVLAANDTFTVQFTVNTAIATDTNADPQFGNFTQPAPATVHFSNGLNLPIASFDYLVVDSYFYVPLNGTYDALAFYPRDNSGNLVAGFGFEMRLPVSVFVGDSLQIPANPILPSNNDWYYYPTGASGAHIFGSLSSVSVAPIPEPSSTVLLAALPVLAFTVLKRNRRPRAD